MLRPMSPELKVKERNTAVLKYIQAGFREEGKGRRMRWGFGESRQEMRRVQSCDSAVHEEGYGFDSD